jgi:hypothetical protein
MRTAPLWIIIHYNPEVCSSRLLRSGSLKSRFEQTCILPLRMNRIGLCLSGVNFEKSIIGFVKIIYRAILYVYKIQVLWHITLR